MSVQLLSKLHCDILGVAASSDEEDGPTMLALANDRSMAIREANEALYLEQYPSRDRPVRDWPPLHEKSFHEVFMPGSFIEVLKLSREARHNTLGDTEARDILDRVDRMMLEAIPEFRDAPSIPMAPVKFDLGDVVATQGVMHLWSDDAERASILTELLSQHARGDWGEVCDQDAEANDSALNTGNRVLSAYTVGERAEARKVWIITEADRSVTTILLPEEY